MIIDVPKNAIKHWFKWQSVYTTLSPNPTSVILSDKHCANIYQTEEIYHVRFEKWCRLGRTALLFIIHLYRRLCFGLDRMLSQTGQCCDWVTIHSSCSWRWRRGEGRVGRASRRRVRGCSSFRPHARQLLEGWVDLKYGLKTDSGTKWFKSIIIYHRVSAHLPP